MIDLGKSIEHQIMYKLRDSIDVAASNPPFAEHYAYIWGCLRDPVKNSTWSSIGLSVRGQINYDATSKRHTY